MSDSVDECVYVCAHVALRALCWFCSAVSVTYRTGSVGVPWFPLCCVYSIYLLPKNTLKSISPLSLSVVFSLFSLSIYLPYLLPTSLDLSFQISCCKVVRWCACRQPALVAPSAWLSFPPLHPASPLFACRAWTFALPGMTFSPASFMFKRRAEWEMGKIEVCKM